MELGELNAYKPQSYVIEAGAAIWFPHVANAVKSAASNYNKSEDYV